MRRLPEIFTAGSESVIGADRNVRRLLVIAVQIAEPQTERAIRILHPAFKCRLNALSFVELDLAHRYFLAAQQAGKPDEQQNREYRQCSFLHGCN